ncbi:MAG TPA: ceramidase domain-containing protein, partial [Desulfuromonadales bacterium]
MERRRRLLGSLGLLTLGLAVAVALLPPIPQDPLYHRFADSRPLLGIPNFLNVVSNLPLFVVGLLGLLHLVLHRREDFADQRESRAYMIFFFGTVLIACGSAWYHLAPDNDRLFWDRLPMAVAFMAFTAAMLAERVSATFGSRALLPLLTAGAASVTWWRLGVPARAQALLRRAEALGPSDPGDLLREVR